MINTHWLLVSLMVLVVSSPSEGKTTGGNNNMLIVPARSVGPIALGMPVSAAKQILGKPTSTDDDFLAFNKKGISILAKDGKVSEIVFDSKRFSTKDGLSLSTYDQPAKYKSFTHWKLPWRFMNLKHTLKSGGLSVFETNVDSGDDEYESRVYGVVFSGNRSECGLALCDEQNDGWESWDGNGENLWKGASFQDGLFTTKTQSAGAVGKE
ncbi:MAG: hypothetical protein K2X93_24160 [Candidatus Obscuribacterales bacterium]|nr:hypothetical protein [Candidatus Obscuribacterales bacterium]